MGRMGVARKRPRSCQVCQIETGLHIKDSPSLHHSVMRAGHNLPPSPAASNTHLPKREELLLRTVLALPAHQIASSRIT